MTAEAVQLSFLDESPAANLAPVAAVVVRSHLRVVRGSVPSGQPKPKVEKLPSNGTPTSDAAAERKGAAGTAKTDCMKILEHIVARGVVGSTDEEIFFATKVGKDSHRARRQELQKRGLIEHATLPGTTKPFRRLTKAGNEAQAWRATQAGRDAVAEIQSSARG